MNQVIRQLLRPATRLYDALWIPVRQTLVHHAFEKKPFDLSDVITIFSDPRGGSTWVMELLHKLPRNAAVFEPLHPTFGVVDPSLELGWRPYIPADHQWPAAEANFRELFEGKRINSWTCSKNSLTRYLHAEHLVVKFVRGKALLPWLTNRFAFRRLPILLHRHPIACCLSQQQYFGTRDAPADGHELVASSSRHPFASPASLHGDFLHTLRTDFEVRIAAWCLHNLPVLQAQSSANWCTVFYEDLVRFPEKELGRIFAGLNTVLPEQLLEAVRKPSQTVSRSDFHEAPLEQIRKWTERVTDEELQRTQQILDYFEIRIYSAREYLPL